MGQQTILTVGGLVMLGVFILSGNRLITENTRTTEQTEYVLTALSLAESIIDEAKAKSFDEITASKLVSSVDSLTTYPGREGGETMKMPDTLSLLGAYGSATQFDDVDDYNGYVRLVNTERGAGYTLTVAVKYVSETNPDSDSVVRTFCKRMTVSVTSPYFDIPIAVNYSFTY